MLTGSIRQPCSAETAMAKLYVADTGVEIALACQQVIGAYGLSDAYDIERNLRAPLAGIQRESQRLGLPVPDIRLSMPKCCTMRQASMPATKAWRPCSAERTTSMSSISTMTRWRSGALPSARRVAFACPKISALRAGAAWRPPRSCRSG